MLTKERFMPIFTAMCTMYDKEPTPELVQIYFEVIKGAGMSDDEFDKAVKHVMANRVYSGLPKPGEILQSIKGDPDTQALFAIESVNKAIRDHGPYVSIIFQDPIIGEIIQNFDGGWPGLCARTTEELVWDLKHLTKLYQAKLANGSYGKEPVKLIGICEHSGNEDMKPVMVGGEPVKQIARDEREIAKLRGEG